ncbi:MAG: phenylalanine--tRNA ligase subunit beta [Gemmataceae bacterium]|nr:phenylalanine--tRNA ligase subunit beta [Gemmataceae bacterium]
MKVPLSWLYEYVGSNVPAPQLVERLTLAGLEVASVRVLGKPVPEGLHVKAEDAGPVWERDKLVIGKVLQVEKHPNADRLTLVTVDYGAREPKRLVTGAPNLKVGDVGQKVIVALSGSILFDGHSKDGKKLAELKPKELRGIMNDAMVCSAYELGISEEHEGIILLESDAPVGKPLVDFMGEIILEIDVLPNMARCLSMIGVAREVAALTGGTLRKPPHTVEMFAEPIEGQVKVEIETPKLCARYAAMLIKGVRIAPAPAWMQRRLGYAGMRPISNIVDITNYVMLEWGQPLHAFDYDLLKARAGGQAPTIIVRPAKPGEKMTTLDGAERTLTWKDDDGQDVAALVIADTVGPIALAGVMGGKDTEVHDKTTNILLESANFDFVSIRRTMKHFNLPSEASVRFSKGIHPEIVRPAAERAAELMRQFAGGRVARGLVESYPGKKELQTIALELEEVRNVLGMNFSRKEAIQILRALEFEITEDAPEAFTVKTPPHRTDIQAGSADLIEELVRIHGYDKLPATLMSDQLPEQHTNKPLVLEERVRDILVTAGLQEVITYSLTMAEREAPLGAPALDYVTLRNPISAERVVMRHSVLASVLEVAAGNLKHTGDVRIFEVGKVFLPKAGEKLPEEPRRIALVLTGRRWREFWDETSATADARASQAASLDFYDLKGVIETLAGDLHLPEVSYRPATAPYLHPGRSAELLIKGQPVGAFGQLHPKVAAAYADAGDVFKPLTGRTLLVGELDLEAILAAVPDRYTYTALSVFPAALRDIAVIVPETITADQVSEAIRAGGGDLLQGVRLFDVYRGSSIPEGTKSLAYALTYLASDRTLTDKEVDKAHKKIEDRLKHMLKAQVRGQEAAR